MITSFHGIIPSEQTPPTLLTDLIAYYNMDETSGTTMYDYHTGGYDGTIYNSPTLNGSDYTFDGLNDYVIIPDNDVFSFTDEIFTIQMWTKTAHSSSIRFPLYKSSGGSTFEYGANNAGNAFIFGGTYGTANFVTASPYTWDGDYHHWVFQGDGSTLRLYIDGVLNASSSITISMVNRSSAVNIARYGGGTNYYPGEIKLMGFWDRALGATEISDLYNSGSGLTYAGIVQSTLLVDLIAYYEMDETSGTTMVDSHTYGYDGTIYNSPTLNGSSYTFDGLNDYALIPDNDVFSFTDEIFSVQYWVKSSVTTGFLMYKGSTTGNREYASSTGGDKAAFQINNNGSSTAEFAQGTTNVVDGNWHHIVATADGTNLKVYVDNVLEDTETISISMGNYTSAINIGRYGGGSLYFTGDLKKFAFWDKTLSATEVSDLYNSGSGLTYGNL